MAEPFIGEIKLFGGNFAPLNYATCDGQTLPISQNDALFALIGTTYGGDGQQTFNLPDLRGRVPMHQGQGLGLSSRVIGQSLGTENVTLTLPQLPGHTHIAPCSTAGKTSSPNSAFWATDGSGNIAPYSTQAPNGQMAATAVGIAGGNQPHNNIQPLLCVTFIIALYGIFPSQS